VFAISTLVGAIAMAAFWSLRLYSDWRGAAQPHIPEGLLLAIALPAYLLAFVSVIAAVRRQRSWPALAFFAGGLLVAVGVFLTAFAFGR
jgi:hypothetical protein